MSNGLSTDPYKGVRDFYPEDMAIQRYMFDTWARTAESYGFERYDASILEPAELYRSKTSEEIVNEQTYTFTDRGDREVTLRPEMTPTVARMVAGRRRELSFPLRWYSIPNLFRYERQQRGRLREHWQLNCDIFGTDSSAADIEIIALAHSILTSFGATSDMFEIRINHRVSMRALFSKYGVTEEMDASILTRTIDRKNKMSGEDFLTSLREVLPHEQASALMRDLDEADEQLLKELEGGQELTEVIDGLRKLGIDNVKFSPSLARGFDYYTGTIFEIFDTASENNRSILGGGRYDNLTELFGGQPIPAIGFGMGDVTMYNFLETHGLLSRMPDTYKSGPSLLLITPEVSLIPEAMRIATEIRALGISVAVDLSGRKLAEQITRAAKREVPHIIVVGQDEITSGTFVLRTLKNGEEASGTISTLSEHIR